MRIYLFNDTSSEHAGCRAVMDSLSRALQGHEIIARNAVGERHYDEQAFAQAQAIVVNGEGTLHHGNGAWLMDMLALAQESGKRSLLVNALFQQRSPFHPDVLRRLDYFSVREPRSLASAKLSGGNPELLMDSCVGGRITNGRVTMPLKGLVKGETHPQSSAHGLLDAFDIPHLGLGTNFADFIATARQSSVYITGQHHAIYGCGLAGTPFVALPGNSHKIESLLEWSGLPIRVCTTMDEVNEQIAFALDHPEVFRQFQQFLKSHRCFSAKDADRVLNAPIKMFTFSQRAISSPMAAAKPVKRIVFTGEILQTDFDGKPSMAREIHWLANLLRYSVSRACPRTPIEVVTWPDPFDGARFFTLNNLTPSVDAWAALVDADAITQSSAEYMREFFADSLVIGYGMSNLMLRFLSEAGIPYLDFLLHPARFLDDIFFGIRTNAPEVFAALETYRYPREMIELEAAIHRASLLRMDPLDIAPNAGLFAAQSGVDKALVADGHFTRPEDYRAAIGEFVARHPDVYIKPHPYSRDGARVVALLRAIAGDSSRVHVVQDNVYRLLTQANITEVCGISSCVLYEADYFGKPAAYMARNRMDFEAGPWDPWKFVAVYDQFLNPRFWERILASVCEVASAPDLALPSKSNRLRNNLHVFWGYGYLDYEVPLRHMGIHAAPQPAPQSAEEYHAEGVQLFQAGHPAEASDAFAQALLQEETSERWNDWGVAQLSAGRPQEAVKGFRMAMRVGNDPEAFLNLNMALNLLNQA